MILRENEITKVEIGDAVLYHADCRDVLARLDNVNCVITDPPYGIGFKYESHKDDYEGYGDFIFPIMEQAERLVKSGIVAVFQAAKNARRWHEWFPREWRMIAIGKNHAQWLPCHVQWRTDYVLFWETEGFEKWRTDMVPRDFFVSSDCCKPASGHKRGHPCPRPLDTMIYLVSILSRKGDIVLDPFMGSGTTGVACAKLGRKFIGVEISEPYFKIACERIDREYAQGKLFQYGG